MSDFLPCKYCFDSGLCHATERASGIRVFIRCTCNFGRKLNLGHVPQWTFSFDSEYERSPLIPSEWKPKPPITADKILDVWKEKTDQAKQFWYQGGENVSS